MNSSENAKIRWVGKEAVRYELGSLAADVQCYFDPERNSYLAVLCDMGLRHDQTVRLTAEEMNEVEAALRAKLGVKRLFGVRVGRCEVQIERELHVF
jgi:hypothetical protein